MKKQLTSQKAAVKFETRYKKIKFVGKWTILVKPFIKRNARLYVNLNKPNAVFRPQLILPSAMALNNSLTC